MTDLSNPGDYAVSLLNSLIETTIDSADGFEKAADLVRNPRFQGLFKDRAGSRRKLADELKAEVSGLGAEPWDRGSFRGLAQRAILDVRDRVGGHSDKPVIEDIERGEASIQDQFAEAAHDEQLPVSARALVERAGGQLKSEHDEISAIRREFE